MLSLPDFREKRLIYISHFGDNPQELKFANSNIRLYKNGQFANQISCHLVLGIFIVGHTSLTTPLIEKAQHYGITIILMNHSFKTYAVIGPHAEGNYQIRQLQYSWTKEETLRLSKSLITNKIESQNRLLEQKGKKILENSYETKIAAANSQDILLGLEGNQANYYFQTLFKEIGWYRRAPQTKEDLPNFLLDIGYTFLFHLTDSILRLFGFDTYKGFYHQLFFERKSLTCDLMEPLRPLIDKALLKAYNLKQVCEKDFIFKNGVYQMKTGEQIYKKYSYIFAHALMENKEDIYTYLLTFYRHLMYPKKYPNFIFSLK